MDKEGEISDLTYVWAFAVFEEQRGFMGDSVRGFLTEIDHARTAGSKDRENVAIQMIFRILRDARYLMGDPFWLAFDTELEFRITKTKDGFSLEKTQGVFNFTGSMFETSYVTASDDDFYKITPD